jgi:beta-glucosidase
VEVTVAARALAHWDDEAHAWTIEPGTFHLAVGGSYSDQRLTTELTVAATTQNRS